MRDYKNALDTVLKDYEITNKEIERRENINLLVGTILVGSSFLILGNTANNGIQQIFPYALSSILLFVLWLFVLHYTTAKLDSFGYARIRAIEEAITQHYGYDFGIHRFNYTEITPKDKTEPWAEIRRYFWGIIMIAFSFSWTIISVSKHYR
jgi:hypothetical protein